MTTMSSYTQFGYPYTSQLIMSSSPSAGIASSSSSSSSSSVPLASATSPSSGENVEPPPHPPPPPSASPCCDSGRPLVTDPVTGQTVCSCQYERLQAQLQNGLAAGYGAAAAARLAAVSSAVTGVTGLHGVYSYPSSDQNPYPSLGMDSTTAFYSSLTNPYSLKEGGSAAGSDAWSTAPGLHQSAQSYYPYDPALAAYGYGASYDLAARRKNATRESTATLKAWLSEHKKNPYPTKGEKIMLAIITKMTLTQVSTWFANARRRLKKENKMTWEPKNRNDDDDDDDSGRSDDESPTHGKTNKKMKHSKIDKDVDEDKSDCDDDSRSSVSPVHPHHLMHPAQHHSGDVSVSVSVSNYHQAGYQHHQHEMQQQQQQQQQQPANKPKIWSLADTAACKTPPPAGASSSSGGGMMAMMHPAAAAAAAAAAAHHHHHLAAANHHSWFNGPMSSMTGAAKMAAGFGSYGRYPSLTGYGNSAYNGYTTYTDSVQTDTPPQTPPNLKNGQHLQSYHPYVSPQQQQHRMPPPIMSTTSVDSPIMAAPSATPSTSSPSAAESFRPLYRTSPIGGYPS